MDRADLSLVETMVRAHERAVNVITMVRRSADRAAYERSVMPAVDALAQADAELAEVQRVLFDHVGAACAVVSAAEQGLPLDGVSALAMMHAREAADAYHDACRAVAMLAVAVQRASASA